MQFAPKERLKRGDFLSLIFISKSISKKLFKIVAFQNPEFKILDDWKILAFPNPEFKILAAFKIVALQNPQFKFWPILSFFLFKLLNSKF